MNDCICNRDHRRGESPDPHPDCPRHGDGGGPRVHRMLNLGPINARDWAARCLCGVRITATSAQGVKDKYAEHKES